MEDVENLLPTFSPLCILFALVFGPIMISYYNFERNEEFVLSEIIWPRLTEQAGLLSFEICKIFLSRCQFPPLTFHYRRESTF